MNAAGCHLCDVYSLPDHAVFSIISRRLLPYLTAIDNQNLSPISLQLELNKWMVTNKKQFLVNCRAVASFKILGEGGNKVFENSRRSGGMLFQENFEK